MKKIVYFIILTTISFNIFAEETKLSKRTIVILPFVNQNKITDYSYLSNTLIVSLKAKLLNADLFNFVSFSDVDSAIKNYELKENDFNDIVKSTELALNLKSDILIIGKYSVVRDKIIISSTAVDVLGSQSAVYSTVKGKTGVEILDLIDSISRQMTIKISKEFPQIDKHVLEDFFSKREKAKVENERKQCDILLFKFSETDDIGVIKGTNIEIKITKPILLNNLKPIFTINGNKVTVDGKISKGDGSEVFSFLKPLTFRVYALDDSYKDYQVTANLKVQTSNFFYDFESDYYKFYDNKTSIVVLKNTKDSASGELNTFSYPNSFPFKPSGAVEIKFKIISGEISSGYGISFCYQDEGNFHRFVVNKHGDYQISKKIDGTNYFLKKGEWVTQRPETWKNSSNILKKYGAENTIKIVNPAKGIYEIYINGKKEADFTEEKTFSGKTFFIANVNHNDEADFPNVPILIMFKFIENK